MTPSRARVYLIAFVLVAYLMSFFLPAVYREESGSGEFHSRGGPVPGAFAIVFGAVMMVGGCPGWLSNPISGRSSALALGAKSCS